MYDWVKPILPRPCIIAGRVNASARNSTSGSTFLTCQISQSQKLTGLVCGLSTRKILTPCSTQCSTTRSTSARMPGRVVVEVERVDVLVLLRRVLGVGDRAVGPRGEPLRVLGDPRVVGRALQRQVHRDLQARPRAAASTNAPEVLQRAEFGMDRVVAALGRADRPRRADVGRPGDQRVVAALAVDPADRVDRRQVEHVEAHRRDGRAAARPRWRTCRAAPACRRPR